MRMWVGTEKRMLKFFRFPAKYQENWKHTRFRLRKNGCWVRLGAYVYAVRWDR